jgi:hypothetical protein
MVAPPAFRVPDNRKSMRIFGLALAILLLLPLPGAPQAPSKDVILVLDNSGSMKKNDPGFLAKQAVEQFISGLDDQTRAGVLIFDQSVNLAVPLTPVTDESREVLRGSLAQINYRGQFTDSPSAIERALYELKTTGRAEADKAIIFMTDGIVDTGKPELDVEKTRWLREDLAAEASENGIRIFAIAFTEQADFLLIQSLAGRTDGEYFRALQPEDLAGAFARVKEILEASPEPPGVEPPALAGAPVAPGTPVALPPAEVVAPDDAGSGVVIVRPPVDTAADERAALTLVAIVGAVVLLLIVIIIVLLVRRRGPAATAAAAQFVPQAFLNDLHGYSADPSYAIGARPVMLGRVAGTDKSLDYIVINQTTVGRRHAIIEYRDFSFWIVDQGSVNGTFVNGEQVDGERRLKHGDKIKLHKFEFEFVVPELSDSGKTVFSGPTAEDAALDKTVVGTTAISVAAVAPGATGDGDDADIDFFDAGGGEREVDEGGAEAEIDFAAADDDSSSATDVPDLAGRDTLEGSVPSGVAAAGADDLFASDEPETEMPQMGEELDDRLERAAAMLDAAEQPASEPGLDSEDETIMREQVGLAPEVTVEKFIDSDVFEESVVEAQANSPAGEFDMHEAPTELKPDRPPPARDASDSQDELSLDDFVNTGTFENPLDEDDATIMNIEDEEEPQEEDPDRTLLPSDVEDNRKKK